MRMPRALDKGTCKRIDKIHFKDYAMVNDVYEIETDLLRGSVDYTAIMPTLREIGYDGWGYPGSFPFSETFRVKFEKATLVFDHNGFMVYPENDGEGFTPELEAAYVAEADTGINITSLGEYFNELNYFIDMLSKGEKPVRATLQEAVDSVRLVWKEIELCGGKTKKQIMM